MAVAIPERTYADHDSGYVDKMLAVGGWLDRLNGESEDRKSPLVRGEDTCSPGSRATLSDSGGRASAEQAKMRASQHFLSFEKERDAMDVLYRDIGAWGGGAEDTLRSWTRFGQAGALWLIRRMRTETDAEVLCGISTILSNYGGSSIRPILEEAEENPGPDQAEALLRALAWIGTEIGIRDLQRQAKRVCKRYLQPQSPPELRQAATVATRCLPGPMALRLLEAALRDTDDEETREYVASEIQDREG